MLPIILFIIFSFINVVLNTLKTIITARATPRSAAIINAVTFGFYVIIVKQLASFDLWLTIPVTIITNYIGVQFSLFLLNKFSKDFLWKIVVTSHLGFTQQIKDELKENNISYNEIDLVDKYTNQIDIFSKSQKESSIIKKILSKYEIKYHVIEINKSL